MRNLAVVRGIDAITFVLESTAAREGGAGEDNNLESVGRVVMGDAQAQLESDRRLRGDEHLRNSAHPT